MNGNMLMQFRRFAHPGSPAGQTPAPIDRALRPTHRFVPHHRIRRAVLVSGALLIIYAGFLEARTSRFQSQLFSRVAEEIEFHTAPGASSSVSYPRTGPFNERLGYSQLGNFTGRALEKGFRIESQAVLSKRLQDISEMGLFSVYHEKSQAGLTIVDRDGSPLFRHAYPEQIYQTFDSIPPVLWRTLLFIENRELFDESRPYLNPAVEWDRLGIALLRQIGHKVGLAQEGPGASTLATQLQKFRYSPGGYTGSIREKLRQMTSASLHAYLDGRETITARRKLVTDYLNTMPLAGAPGFGEVIGMADGLKVWYGADFGEVNRILRSQAGPAAGTAYRQVLSLLLANRRPSYFLNDERGRESLAETTDSYLHLLAGAGVIPSALSGEALKARAPVVGKALERTSTSYLGRKAALSIRAELMGLLGARSLYDLDRYDLSVETTVDRYVQARIDSVLAGLHDPSQVKARGMEGFRLLGSGNPENVYYALTIFEARPEGNLLRIQSDNFDGPFNVNEGSKLELGSTAKLRTLVNYLQIVEALYSEYAARDVQAGRVEYEDPLTTWANRYLRTNPDRSLEAMLDAALNRSYSASPYEQFFTGGGLHVFHNFSGADTTQRYTVRTGFRHSVNLVFIRMLRDIESYYAVRLPGNPMTLLENAGDPGRTVYLRRFADREGRQYLWTFFKRYEGDSDVWQSYVRRHRPTPLRLGWALRSSEEGITLARFRLTLARLGYDMSEESSAELFGKADVSSFNWQDRGYLAGVHPLELWYLRHRNSGLTWSGMVEAAHDVRQEVYQWLFTRASKSAQDNRIRTLIEEDAFVEIHKAWKKVGYPFDRLVPSYATAIGSSADRPQALAELVGIIMRGGLRFPSYRIAAIHFAEDTPYETRLSPSSPDPEHVLSTQVSSALRGALLDVVENGTGRRIYGGIMGRDGEPLLIGGKTGTGDNRTRIYGASGQTIGQEVQNRTSTFVFFIDDRFFGTVTAFVIGPDAGRYGFTSSLPVQLLKALGPDLSPLLDAR